MERLRLIFSESIRSLGANISTTLAAAVTVLIGMFLLGLFIAVWSWAHSYDKQLKNQLVVRVYFCTKDTCPASGPATKAQENAVAARLSNDARIKRVEPVTKEQALEIMLAERKPKQAAEKPGETTKPHETAPVAAAVATKTETIPGMEGLDHAKALRSSSRSRSSSASATCSGPDSSVSTVRWASER